MAKRFIWSSVSESDKKPRFKTSFPHEQNEIRLGPTFLFQIQIFLSKLFRTISQNYIEVYVCVSVYTIYLEILWYFFFPPVFIVSLKCKSKKNTDRFFKEGITELLILLLPQQLQAALC